MLVSDLQKRLATEKARSEKLASQNAIYKAELERACSQIMSLTEERHRLEADLTAFEKHFATPQQGYDVELNGKTLLYVGGKSSTIKSLDQVTMCFGGTLLHHDGGLEESLSLLPGLISKAEIVFFPVDFVSHQAVILIKRHCNQLAVPFVPLHRSGVAGFLRAIADSFKPN